MSLQPCFIDLETRSTLDLKKVGVHRYAEDRRTDVLVACYAFGPTGPVRTWWKGNPPPLDLMAHVVQGGLLVAHNAEFERTLWREVLAARYGWTLPKLEQWVCTAAMASAMALPRSLEMVGAALGLPIRKDMEGNRLMLQMCKPRSYASDGSPVWWEDAEKMARLARYCGDDVRVTQQVYPRLRPLSELERQVWLLDARMNDRGITVDLSAVRAAKAIVADTERELLAELRKLTGGAVSTAKQVQKLRDWFASQGLALDSLEREAVKDALEQALANLKAGMAARGLPAGADLVAKAQRLGVPGADVARALEIRLELSKSSTAKLEAMELRASARDSRARGNLVYHVATTGRWAGVGIQLQNLPRGSLPKGVTAEMCFRMLMTGNAKAVELVWGSPMSVVSSSLRTMLTAGPGNELVVADFANIEGRVLAWLAGEASKLAAFAAYDAGTGPDLYLVAAAGIYGRPVSSFTKDSPERQIGKVAELALGYQGGVRAFNSMAANYGVKVPDEQADEIKRGWRAANPNIVSWWWDLEDAAKAAIRNPSQVFACRKVSFVCAAGFLWMRLPSGRLLAYCRPSLKMKDTPRGAKETIHFWGVDSYTKKWCEQTTYGGKLAENATQAVARDIMAEALLRVEAAGYPAILSVHDEAISEVPEGTGDVAFYERTMAVLPAWAGGLPVTAAGWKGKRYKKG